MWSEPKVIVGGSVHPEGVPLNYLRLCDEEPLLIVVPLTGGETRIVQ